MPEDTHIDFTAIQGAIERSPQRRPPLWRGPIKDGITQSLFSGFFTCRERLRLLLVYGLKPAEGFVPPLEYGHMFHTCEDATLKGEDWRTALSEYCASILSRESFDPMDRAQVFHWKKVCELQYPHYLDHWKDSEATDFDTVCSEKVFYLPYPLPSGRYVMLRGKIDAILLSKGKKKFLILKDHKTKGQIDEQTIYQQLKFDFQTMFYFVATLVLQRVLQEESPFSPRDFTAEERSTIVKYPIQEVHYNVVRRPLSGGKGSIRKHKPTKKNPEGESDEHFYERLDEVFKDNRDSFFYQWRTEISMEDVIKFEKTCLIPSLEEFLDWWEWVSFDPHNLDTPRPETIRGHHWRLPYGIYNPIADGRYGKLDHYLNYGDLAGLQYADTLYPEL